MDIRTHGEGDRIAELVSEEILVSDAGDAVQLIADLYYQGFDRIIIHERNIAPDFFDLKTGVAGDVLQKFSNYSVRLAIIGEFTKYPGKSIRDFIYESNKGRLVNFLGTVAQAAKILST
jgi:hypothetical protein